MKTVTIDGQEYELSKIGAGVNSKGIIDDVYALKPITAAEDEKRSYCIDVHPTDALANYDAWKKSLVLTEDQAHAMFEAIQALVEYVTEGPQLSDQFDPVMRAANKARSAFHD